MSWYTEVTLKETHTKAKGDIYYENFFKESSLGFVKNTAWKIVGPELTKVGLTPILNMYLGIEDEGPSNQDVM